MHNKHSLSLAGTASLMLALFFMAALAVTPVLADHGKHHARQADSLNALDQAGKQLPKKHCKSHGKGHHADLAWKRSLSDEQKASIDQIKATYKKDKMVLKARKKALKIELMALATADNPDQQAIDAKIFELLDVKKTLLQAKTRKVAAVRALLTAEQRSGFDLYVLKKAEKGKHGKKSCKHCRH